ncbi:MAG: D-alanyl-D-alanine carboxypeptidase/D-alanyl-D-alanine-endopeptidase [Glaciihabitans sp.]|nr:D-alanyl-D-alanine carboxypeptidase/D-alanyl-D-alanine-endopeptidase [Glaciihabitans sp.]
MGRVTEPSTSFLARHRFTVVASALAIVFLLASAGAVSAGFMTGASATRADIAASATPAPVVTNAPGRTSPAVIPAATPVRSCTVSPQAVDAALGTLRGSVVDVMTGETVFSRTPDYISAPGSAMAALTATAAVSKLGADYRLSTSVLDSNSTGTIVLVGGGDPTLTALGEGEESVYAGAAKLDDLATSTLVAFEAAHPGKKITQIVLDASYWDKADRWNSTWDRSLQTGGSLSEVTALQVDGDRDDPRAQVSPRSTEPIKRAGIAFAKALGLDPDDITIREGKAENGATLLGQVNSAPLSTLVQQMLSNNDATLAEAVARVLSVETGFGGSAASLQQAIPQVLKALGLDTSDLTIRDGSGLSNADAVPASFLSHLMAKVSGEEPLASVLLGLPIAAETGSLAGRFTGDNASAAGQVSAASGAVNGSRSLAGVINSADETPLAFAFVATGNTINDDANTALDTLVAAIQACGSNLTNN